MGQVWGPGKVRNTALDAIILRERHIRCPGGAVSRHLDVLFWILGRGPRYTGYVTFMPTAG